MMRKLHSFGLVLAMGLVLPAHAWAYPRFPGLIQNHFGLSAAPPTACLLCHGSTSGGGPVVQPFGKALIAAGFNGSSGQAEVDAALNKLDQDKTDSNGDGISDYDSLAAGLDPNPGGEPIQYGCGGQIASHRPLGWQAAAMGVLTFAWLLMRRSRKSQGTSSCAHA